MVALKEKVRRAYNGMGNVYCYYGRSIVYALALLSCAHGLHAQLDRCCTCIWKTRVVVKRLCKPETKV